MHDEKGGAPSGQRAATQKRQRDKEEEKNPDAKTQREEDGKEAKRNFSSRDTARQSLPNIDIEMSGEPSAAPVFTTRTTPVNGPLLAFDPPPKKLDQRVDGQVYIHEDGLLKGVRVKWSASSGLAPRSQANAVTTTPTQCLCSREMLCFWQRYDQNCSR